MVVTAFKKPSARVILCADSDREIVRAGVVRAVSGSATLTGQETHGMTEKTQFCIGLDNKPGQLARLCAVFLEAGVNIEALCVSDDTDGVWVNVVATPEDVADRVLLDHNYRFLTEKVVTMQVGNQPGELGRIAAKLAEVDVNINSVYGAGADGHPCNLVLNVNDAGQAMKALEDVAVA